MKRFCITLAAFAALLMCVGNSHAFGRRGHGGCGVGGGCGSSYGCGVSYGAPVSYGSYATPTYSAPSYGSYSQPTYSAPSYGSYSQPTYSAPSYGSYSQPTYSGPTYSTPVYSPGCSTSYSTGPIQPGQWIMTQNGWAQVISVGPSKTETPREIRRMPEPEKEGGKKPKAPSIDD